VFLRAERNAMEQLLFAPWLADALRDSRLIRAECEPATLSLLKSAFRDAKLDRAGAMKPADLIEDRIQLSASLGDLAAAYARSSAGWLTFDPATAQSHRARLAADDTTSRLVGLAWVPSGSERGGLEAFDPLLAVPGIRWVALPVGAVGSKLAQYLLHPDCPLIFEPAIIRDGLDSAAAWLPALDLMVSSEDLVATLAGALGKPVWKVAGVNAHWSWGAAGETSKWHPTARIHRISQAGEPPLEALRVDLERFSGI
jgi:hypothetical protein